MHAFLRRDFDYGVVFINFDAEASHDVNVTNSFERAPSWDFTAFSGTVIDSSTWSRAFTIVAGV